ncbi:hypothetical protein OE88DRAFT_1713557 [Heliocybe sulcata]|uniref:E3 ubiquitin-protein ligase listerin n=1 Tax=Heliocybe sulcata TaxID=5364 RepID=A0A5C3MVZ1_9AGAM|nr:hypothetical protein OE88DRAFT_1713557 [Heliocybe sulcata]
MAKSHKSSASSATKKKHARKAGGPQPQDPALKNQKKDKTKGKGKNKEPRKKVYIPPYKPPPPQPDPLDTFGLAKQLPPELLVVLRSLKKKDSVTKAKALEELRDAWVEKAVRERDEEAGTVTTLVLMLPVWAHHIPSLFFSPSRRIRLLATTVHASLLRLSAFRVEFLTYITDVASPDQISYVLGTWCMAASDPDRLVSRYARQSFEDFVTLTPSTNASTSRLVLNESTMASLLAMISRTALDPAGVYLQFHPPIISVEAVVPGRKGGKQPHARQPKRDEETSTRAKPEDEEESEDDRKARLRIGALGALRWVLDIRKASGTQDQGQEPRKDLREILSSRVLWTCLHEGLSAPWISDLPSFGYNQPGVRRSAWLLLQSVESKELLPVLSTAVLRSAWVEGDAGVRSGMWQPLMMFLKSYPEAWMIDASSTSSSQDEDEGSGSEDETGDEEEDESASAPATGETSEKASAVTGRSQAYTEFLHFLSTGCSNSPLQGCPTVVIVLSTLPASFLTQPSLPGALEELFVAFWDALDSRALSGLDRDKASAAFLEAVLECTLFLVRRVRQDPAFQGEEGVEGVSRGVVESQFRKVMEELLAQRLKIDEVAGGSILAKQLGALETIDEELFTAAWTPIANTAHSGDIVNTQATRFVAVTLRGFWDAFREGSKARDATASLIRELVERAIANLKARVSEGEGKDGEGLMIESVMEVMSEILSADSGISAEIDEAIQGHVAQLVTTAPSLLLTYLVRRGDVERVVEVWHQVLDTVSGKDTQNLATSLKPFLGAEMPAYLEPEDGEMDEAFGKLLADEREGEVVQKVLRNPKPFLSSSCVKGIVENLTSAFGAQLQQALRDSVVAMEPFERVLGLLRSALSSNGEAEVDVSVALRLFPDLAVFGWLLPRYMKETGERGESAFDVAREMWREGEKRYETEAREVVRAVFVGRLRDLVVDTEVVATPGNVLDMVAEGVPGLYIHPMDVIPGPDTLRQTLEALPTYTENPSAAVVTNLIPPPSLLEDTPTISPEYDIQGYSRYGRVTTALARIFSSDRQSAKEHIWAVQHLLAGATYAEDAIHLQEERNPLCSRQVSKAELQTFISRVQLVAAYLLVPDNEEGWHAKVVSRVQDKAEPTSSISFLAHVIRYASEKDSPREARIVYAALQPIMGSASKEDGDQWILLARKMAPLASMAIVSSVTKLGPEPPRLDRYRNELAAGVLGIRAAKANEEGLWTLMRLAAAAPDPDSDVVFLPQLRAVNLVKACQGWVESDEDIEEEVESVMTLVLYHLAPILQGVPGGHWDFIFDVTENNLENCSFNDESSLVTLARTLWLVTAIQDLATTNKSLRAVWEERRQSVLTLVRDLVASRETSGDSTKPQSICLELAMSIIQDLPQSLLDDKTLPSMCRILLGTSTEAQKMAYQLLQESTQKYTENLVIEAGVDTEATVKCELPVELVDILQRGLLDDDDYVPKDPFGYFLAWMAAFDLFSNASFRVKSGYIQHLRSLDVISAKFVPYVFNALGLYGGPRSTFRLDPWAVDEYYISVSDPETPFSVPLQAAHLYYRSLLIIPSLIRSWLQECKDRSLSTTVTTFTSQHYSPVIIATEFARVKSPDATSELEHENLAIKVAAAVNEVTASWAVDEHQLEISMKLPTDWPLHPIQVRDSKKVGVEESRWRAWVLGVQQIMSSKNGSIVDGLSLFKKNVSLHFEGQVECAICYSIISPMDYSLPKKPCKTCKNRFHSTCLYKWFNTSHSSTCPLCRSEIF